MVKPRVSRIHQGQPFALAFLLVALAFMLAGCQRQAVPVYLQGATMGTSWSVTLSAPAGSKEPEALQRDIEALLLAVNQSMSTYIPDSEINQLSAAPSGEWLDLSEGFTVVLAEALAVGELSDGAYDVTVGPMVELWGFGPQRGSNVPAEELIAQSRSLVGYSALELDQQQRRFRKGELRELDFSSLAKGYGVDRISELLIAAGERDFLVEIGGEVRVSGMSPRGEPWRLAIERPVLMGGAPMAALLLSQGAVATSGDYRNFFEVDGRRYSHTIDPRTGWPVQHELVSVTVIADNAMRADALATALSVLGVEDAIALARRESLAVYLVSQRGDELRVHKTPEIDTFLQ